MLLIEGRSSESTDAPTRKFLRSPYKQQGYMVCFAHDPGGANGVYIMFTYETTHLTFRACVYG